MKKLEQQKLAEKLRRVENLYRNPGSPGEKEAAASAIRRIQDRLRALQKYSQMTVKPYEFVVFTKE